MRTLTFLATLAIILAGCPEPPEPVAPQITINLGDTYVDLHFGDDDSASETPSDDDSAEQEEEPIPTTIEIYFDALTSQPMGPVEVLPGFEQDFGVYVVRVQGQPGAPFTIRDLPLSIVTNDGQMDFWMNAISLPAYIDTLVIRDPATRNVLMGPSTPEDSWGGVPFSDDVSYTLDENGEAAIPLLLCGQFKDVEVPIEIGFAVRWANGFTAVDQNGEVIPWGILADNGSLLNPTVQVWLHASTPEPEGATMNATLHSNSPSGPAIPQPDLTTLIWNVAISGLNATADSFTLGLYTTDNTQNQWNRCSNLADEGDVELFRYSDPLTAIGEVEFFSTNGLPCSDSSQQSVPVGSVVITNVGIEIGAGQVDTFRATINASGASSINDDVVRMDLLDFSGTDSDGNPATKTGIPITGGAQQF